MARISRTLLIFGGFVAVVGAAFYPIYFRPLLQVEQYIIPAGAPSTLFELGPALPKAGPEYRPPTPTEPRVT